MGHSLLLMLNNSAVVAYLNNQEAQCLSSLSSDTVCFLLGLTPRSGGIHKIYTRGKNIVAVQPCCQNQIIPTEQPLEFQHSMNMLKVGKTHGVTVGN